MHTAVPQFHFDAAEQYAVYQAAALSGSFCADGAEPSLDIQQPPEAVV